LAIITNGGGETETVRAKKISSVLNIYEPEYEIAPDEVILCHTPMKPIIHQYTNSKILITGTGDIKSVMREYSFNNFITSEEYALIYPNLFPHFFVDELMQRNDRRKVIKEVEERLKCSLDREPEIKAIFMLTDVIRWELNMQLFSDMLISTNGVPGEIRHPSLEQFVNFHLACADLIYKDTFPIPRFAAGSFFYSLQHLFQLKYKRDIEYKLYGKPSPVIFNYASKIKIKIIFNNIYRADHIRKI
jgi:HAD superfamily hydrolase (TIGR01456 family)